MGLEEDKKYDYPEKVPNVKGITQISTGFNHTLMLDNYGCVWSVGCNKKGQLGRKSTKNTFDLVEFDDPVQYVAAGYNVSFLICNGQLYSWGKAGVSLHKQDKSKPTKVKSLSPNLTMIDVGMNYAAAIGDG